MKISYTVYFNGWGYEDLETSGVVEIEKPPGAHPDSYCALLAAVKEAERTGKIVDRIGRTVIVNGIPIDMVMKTKSELKRKDRT